MSTMVAYRTNAERLRELRQQSEAACEAAEVQVEKYDSLIAEAEYHLAELRREQKRAIRASKEADAMASEIQDRQWA